MSPRAAQERNAEQHNQNGQPLAMVGARRCFAGHMATSKNRSQPQKAWIVQLVSLRGWCALIAGVTVPQAFSNARSAFRWLVGRPVVNQLLGITGFDEEHTEQRRRAIELRTNPRQSKHPDLAKGQKRTTSLPFMPAPSITSASIARLHW